MMEASATLTCDIESQCVLFPGRGPVRARSDQTRCLHRLQDSFVRLQVLQSNPRNLRDWSLTLVEYGQSIFDLGLPPMTVEAKQVGDTIVGTCLEVVASLFDATLPFTVSRAVMRARKVGAMVRVWLECVL